jgi:hypothetical protein
VALAPILAGCPAAENYQLGAKQVLMHVQVHVLLYQLAHFSFHNKSLLALLYGAIRFV